MGEFLVALYLASGQEVAAAAKAPVAEIDVRCEYGSAVHLDGVDVATCLEDRVSLTVRPGLHRVEVIGGDPAKRWKTSVVVLKGEHAAVDVERGTVAIEQMRRPDAPSVTSLAVARSAAAAGEPVEIRLAFGNDDMQEAASRIDYDTGGRVRVSWFGANVEDQAAVARSLSAGEVDMACISGAGLEALAPSLRVMDLPMLFRDYAEVDAVRAALGAEIDKELAEAGLVRLAWVDPGFLYLLFGEDLSDLSGLELPIAPDQAYLGGWLVAAGAKDTSDGLKQTKKAGWVHLRRWSSIRHGERSDPVAHITGVVVARSSAWSRVSLADQEAVIALMLRAQASARATEEAVDESRRAGRRAALTFTYKPPSAKLLETLETAAGAENEKYAKNVGGEKLLEAIEAELAKLRGTTSP